MEWPSNDAGTWEEISPRSAMRSYPMLSCLAGVDGARATVLATYSSSCARSAIMEDRAMQHMRRPSPSIQPVGFGGGERG